MFIGDDRDWEEALPDVLYGYRIFPLGSGAFPFELLYEVKPRITPGKVPKTVELAEGNRDYE